MSDAQAIPPWGTASAEGHQLVGEFFKGWRRKAGLVTLAMAMLLTAVWIRSNIVTDQFKIQAFGDLHVIRTGRGAFVWMRRVGVKENTVSWFNHFTIAHHAPEHKNSQWNAVWTPPEYWRQQWRYGIGDVSIASHEQPVDHGQPISTPWCRFPYWSLALPLTLLSAWLILGNRRREKPPT